MKFKVYLKNNNTHIIEAKSLNDAEKKATIKWKHWEDIYLLKYIKYRKSLVLEKRQYVKKSDKIYDRKKSKKETKKEIEDN